MNPLLTHALIPLLLTRALPMGPTRVLGGVLLLWCIAGGRPVSAWQTTPDPMPRLNRFPRMMQEYLVQRVRRIDAARQYRLQQLDTAEAAEAYRDEVRRKIRECFGSEPPRTPLNARTTRVTLRDGYRIENVIFESRPGFPVTANLYLPTDVASPRPAVVGTCGHSENGKALPAYQAFAQGLVRRGYVVLLYDPIGQGERLQYVDELGKPQHGVGVSEHLHAGNQQLLVGQFFGAWRAWDGIRALDYLTTRPEVDANRIGITGNSGGGTMTTWLWGLDERWAMAAPSCFVTSFRRNVENELPADIEQCPPHALEFNLDHADFLLAGAPKPVILLAKERDYFDVRGSQQAYVDVERICRLLGRPDRVSLFVGPTSHGYSAENREAMYTWFDTATQQPHITLPEVPPEPDEVLHCTPHGQVVQDGVRTVFDFTQELASELLRRRGPVAGETLRAAVHATLRLEIPTSPPEFRILRPRRSRHYPLAHAANYAVETEPGVLAIVYRLDRESVVSRPPRVGGTAVLYVAGESSDQELREFAELRSYIQNHSDVTWYTCDVRGIGESRPDTCDEDSYNDAYGSDYFYAVHGVMLGDPYPGQRTRDILRVVQWLAAQNHDAIEIIAHGRARLPAMLAGYLSTDVRKVTLTAAPESFQSIAQTRDYECRLSDMIPDVLLHFDVEDVARELTRQSRLEVLQPTGAESP